jgi:hypothetical protein
MTFRSPRPERLSVALSLLLLFLLVASPSRAASLILSEFLASNALGLADENGDREDWIELRNTGTQAVNTDGWCLTDDAEVPAKWRLPATNIPPGGFLIVFASAKDRRIPGAPLHANFSLNNQGEFLALYQPDAETVATAFAPQFPPQAPDVSFGLDAAGTQRFFQPPTPGTVNGSGFIDRVADTKFSVDRGFFDSPFDLTIVCATEGAQIRYTTNGTLPTATSGIVYTGAIRIAGTTALRAAAFKAGLVPSNTDSHSYLFTRDIITQSPTGSPPPGWPSSWGSNTRDYGMDPDVVNDPRYRDKIQGALKSLPSFCVTLNLPDLFDPTRGIYANPGQDGRAWERPMSLELVFPDGRKGFQIDGGIRIRGGFSRSTGNPKHAFRFFFRPEYGASKLKYPVFGEQSADEFEGFDLRTFQNYSWSFQGDPRGTFIRDMFNRDTQLATGSQAERGDYYHLYINGQYWGLFNTCERPEASYAETYYGGDKDEYDVIKVEAGPYTTVATDGTLAGWTQVYNLARNGVNDVLYRRLLGQNPDGTRNPAYPVYLDPVNLTDYMLIILWGGNLDAPISNFLGNTSPNNYFGIWNRVRQNLGFQWFVHDAEHTLLDVNSDRTGPWPAGDSSVTKSNPQWLWQKLLASQEFKMVVRDRIQRHFFNGGPLSADGARATYLRRRTQIDSAVIAESARWGDAKRPNDPFDRDSDWVVAVNANLSFIAARPAVVLNQLRNDGLFPSISVPQFNQQGGTVNSGFALLMAPSTATIYYTLDGTDPRRPGGAVAPGAVRYTGPVRLTESTLIKARTFENTDWSALNEAEFVIAQTFNELALSEIHYHPVSTPDRDGDEFEFLELKNVGRQTLDLSGVQFTNGIAFRFPNGSRLAPGNFAVLVRNAQAFASRYPGVPIAGVYTGGLGNSGERLTLVHATGTPIFSLAYDTRPPWPELADGKGFSLVPIQANSVPSADTPSAWRASSKAGGSPGADDSAPGIVPVVVNEILTHTDPPLIDAVELHNPTDTPAPIGGWWLSDDRQTPAKFRIPAGTIVPPRGYLAFSELDFNRPLGAPTAFTFSSYGDEVWIFSADTAGNLTGYSDGFGFPATPNAATLGRFTNSLGQLRYPTQSANTLGAPNAAPVLGPVVFNEIHYAPADGNAEFVELRNTTSSPVPLFDPLAPTNTWRINGLGFSFPRNVSLPPNGLALVTPGDPAAFRSRYGIPEAIPIFGPCEGTLQDNGETLTLERPDKPDLLPDGSWFVPYLIVEQVDYDNTVPWPTTAAGQGASLERKSPLTFADDPAAWAASFGDPSPGSPNDGNRPPVANAGPDVEIEAARFPLAIPLAGRGSDDGLPVIPGRLSYLWSQLDGPGVVTFDDASRSNAVAQLPGTGVYRLRLTVSDGDRLRTDDLTVTTRRPSVQQALVAADSTWRYLDNGTDQGTAWRERSFNDASWKTGTAEFGYGDSDEKTVLAINGTAGTKTTTFYFRKSFTVADPRAVQSLNVRLVRDDGANVYLNGTLVFRSNMPEGNVNFLTWASEVAGNADETAFFEQAADPALLVAGVNVLAVEVHQVNAGSSDVSFNLALDAQTSASNNAPTADAGPDTTAPLNTPFQLTGRYSDDGLPAPPGVVSFTWTQREGPATATLEAASSPSPRVTFPAAGRYVLRFTVTDGALSATDDITLTVAGAPDDYAAWKARHFTPAELANPAISGDDADPDADAQSNRAEYQSGTDPRNAASVLRVISITRGAGTLQLTFAAVTGYGYAIQKRASLETGTWEPVLSVAPGNCDCPVTINLPLPPATSGPVYFQVMTPGKP